MTWWGWALTGLGIGVGAFCYAIMWIERELPDDGDWPRRWR